MGAPSLGNESNISLSRAVGYCAIVSISFVASMFVLVPRHIQALSRNSAKQIQWRFISTAGASVGALLLYPLMIVDGSVQYEHQPKYSPLSVGGTNIISKSFLQSTLAAWKSIVGPAGVACFKVLAHCAILYVGPIVRSFVEVYEYRSRLLQEHDDDDNLQSSFIHTYYQVYWQPVIQSLWVSRETNVAWLNDRQWMTLRTLLLAPITEEITFRACIVSALENTHKLQPCTIIFVSPLYFGLAHVHHALTRMRHGEQLQRVAVETLFQFTYTTLFGSYATFVYLRTKSVAAVIAAHSFCNMMGLPDMSFLRRYENDSIEYTHRRSLLVLHALGVAGFIAGSNYVIPAQRV